MIDFFADYLKSTNDDGLDIPEFVVKNCPDLVSDLEGFSKFLYSDRPQRQIADFILASNKAIDFLEHNRNHSKGYKPNYYKAYTRFADPTYALSKRDFYSWFNFINNLELDKSFLKVNQKIVDVVGTLRNEGVADFLIKNAYLKLCSSRNIIPSDLWPELDPFCFQSDAKYIDIVRRFNISLNCSLNGVLEFFSYLNLQENDNDILLENLFLFPRVKSFFLKDSSSGPVVFVDPDYYFIRRVVGSRYPFGNSKCLFFLKDQNVVEVINSALPRSSKFSFFPLSEFGVDIENPLMIPSLSVFFLNHPEDPYFNVSLLESFYNRVCDQHKLMALVPDSFLFSETLGYKSFFSKCCVSSVDLLPSGIEDATSPKRKSVIYAEYGYVKQQVNIEVKQYKLYKGNSRTIARKPFQFVVDKEDLFDSNISLRDRIFNESRKLLTKSENKERAAEEFRYSNEISVFYTCSGKGSKENPFRIQAHVSYPRTTSVNNRRILSTRGSAKLLSNESISEWIDTYMYSNRKQGGTTISIQDEVSKIYVPAYKGKSITLKSFVYLHPELFSNLPEYSKSLLRSVNRSFLSDVLMHQISREYLLAYIDSELDENKYTVRQFLSVFSAVFKLAANNGNCIHNPAAQILKESAYENWGLTAVKDALTQKFFYRFQIKKIVNHAVKLIESGIDVGLGVAILLRLYLGIEANIISALLWKDVAFDSTGISFIYTTRQCDNKGEALLPFSSNKLRRNLPLKGYILEILQKEKERQLAIYANGNEEYLLECTVVHGDDYIINGQAAVYSPAKLNTKIRKLIKKVGLDPDLLSVPDDKFGSVETNIAYYTGDIFKTNYAHYVVKENPKVDQEYLYYLLGYTIQWDTLTNNYVDYLEDTSLEVAYDLQPTFEER